MRAIIVGAGEVGKQLAKVLSESKNDVIVIDQNEGLLEQLNDSLDVMTVQGNGSTSRALLKAGINKADLLLAVTNNSEANILACTVAKQFGVAQKIARLRSNEYFDVANGLTEASFGIDKAIIPEYECATGIFEALMRPAVKETVKFTHPDAQMVNIQLLPGSPMLGCKLQDFPRRDLVENLRICGVVRFGQFIIPRGQTILLAHDEVYVAGAQNRIDALISWACPKQDPASKVVIGGASKIGRTLASMLATFDMRVTMIEPDAHRAELAADQLGTQVLILTGESTDRSVLEEAGIDVSDAYISCHEDNESNVLSCIMAKREGAQKVITVTNHPDYIRIISGMNMIDCGFSPLVESINLLIQQISPDHRRTVALLKRAPAEVMELAVTAKSPVSSKLIKDIHCPAGIVLALILRDNQLVPAVGNEMLKVGDHVVVIARSESVAAAEKMFLSGRVFG